MALFRADGALSGPNLVEYLPYLTAALIVFGIMSI
jgi:hypothetical protein